MCREHTFLRIMFLNITVTYKWKTKLYHYEAGRALSTVTDCTCLWDTYLYIKCLFFLILSLILTLSEWLLDILLLPHCMQYYNMNLVFIKRTLPIFSGNVWSKTRDLIYLVTKFWPGTRVTVKLCPDVAKIQSLRGSLSHNCSPLQSPLWTCHLINNTVTDGMNAVWWGQKCTYAFI